MALLAAQFLVVVAVLVVLRPFLVPMAWAGVLALATWPLFRTLFFLYRDGEALTGQAALVVRRYSGERLWKLLLLLASTVRAVLYGTLFTALGQALLAMPGYWLAGLGNPALLAVLTGLVALTPGGAAVVWLPASVWLAVDGRHQAALLLAAWGALVVSTADNVIRSWFLSGAGRMPFLLSLLGILGGAAAFGTIGLFIGPAALAVLLALWREWARPE